jgi:two-component system nitrogen regulation response regulator NtrX
MHIHTILVIDDSPGIRLICRVNLEAEGHRVLEAANLTQARAALAESEPAIVLLDVHVGPEDGLAFLDEIRESHPELPVVLLSGSVEIDRVRERADGAIAKPFELDALRDAVSLVAPARA